jgi:hypothetical protein
MIIRNKPFSWHNVSCHRRRRRPLHTLVMHLIGSPAGVSIPPRTSTSKPLSSSVLSVVWSDAQTPDSACSTHCIGYNHCESPAMVAAATPSGKSQLGSMSKTNAGRSYGARETYGSRREETVFRIQMDCLSLQRSCMGCSGIRVSVAIVGSLQWVPTRGIQESGLPCSMFPRERHSRHQCRIHLRGLTLSTLALPRVEAPKMAAHLAGCPGSDSDLLVGLVLRRMDQRFAPLTRRVARVRIRNCLISSIILSSA